MSARLQGADAVAPETNESSMYRYPVKLKRDTNRTILVTFPDVREAITFGDHEEDALHRGLEALEAALSIYIDQGREIPRPSETASKRSILIGLPASSEAKLVLYAAMKRSRITSRS